MRKILFTCILVLVANSLVNAQESSQPPDNAKDAWVKFTSEVGRFSVMLPAQPQEKIEHGPSERTPKAHLFSAKGDNESLFMISFVNYSASSNFNATTNLERNRNQFVKTLEATLLNSRPTTIAGYQALEFSAQNSKFDIKSRIMIVGRSSYQIVYASQRGLPSQADLDRFFESFIVSEPAKGPQ